MPVGNRPTRFFGDNHVGPNESEVTKNPPAAPSGTRPPSAAPARAPPGESGWRTDHLSHLQRAMSRGMLAWHLRNGHAFLYCRICRRAFFARVSPRVQPHRRFLFPRRVSTSACAAASASAASRARRHVRPRATGRPCRLRYGRARTGFARSSGRSTILPRDEPSLLCPAALHRSGPCYRLRKKGPRVCSAGFLRRRPPGSRWRHSRPGEQTRLADSALGCPVPFDPLIHSRSSSLASRRARGTRRFNDPRSLRTTIMENSEGLRAASSSLGCVPRSISSFRSRRTGLSDFQRAYGVLAFTQPRHSRGLPACGVRSLQ